MFDAYMGSLGLTGLAEENLQSRLRGTLLMALSNQEGTSCSRRATSPSSRGYSTLYGDSVGAYGPIKDVYKSQVFRLAKWRNRAAEERGQTPPIPENSIVKPPSAELRPGQVDTDSLPDYDVLDRILELYVDQDQGLEAIVAAGFDAELVARTLRMVDAAEYKRRQYPPGTKISAKGFGRTGACRSRTAGARPADARTRLPGWGARMRGFPDRWPRMRGLPGSVAPSRRPRPRSAHRCGGVRELPSAPAAAAVRRPGPPARCRAGPSPAPASPGRRNGSPRLAAEPGRRAAAAAAPSGHAAAAAVRA